MNMSKRERAIQIRTSNKLANILRRWCFDNDTTMTEVIEEAIIQFLKTKGVEVPDEE
jgi:hypothetical protein